MSTAGDGQSSWDDEYFLGKDHAALETQSMMMLILDHLKFRLASYRVDFLNLQVDVVKDELQK